MQIIAKVASGWQTRREAVVYKNIVSQYDYSYQVTHSKHGKLHQDPHRAVRCTHKICSEAAPERQGCHRHGRWSRG